MVSERWSVGDRGQVAGARLAVGPGASDPPTDRLERCDALFDSFERHLEPPAFAVTRRVPAIVGGQGVDDLIEGQPDTLQTARQADPIDDLDRVVAISRRSTAWFGQHPTSLVEPDRVHRHPSRRSNLTDLHSRLLTLDMTPEFTVNA